MGVKSKRKGSAFENEVAKFLNAALDTKEFARTPGSGAWMGRTNAFKRSGVASAAQDTLRGDLITPKSFPYVIECKSYADSPSYNLIIRGHDASLDGWLKEVEFDAKQADKDPMLFFKTTRKGVFVALPFKNIFPIITQISNVLKYGDYAVVGLETLQDIIQDLNVVNAATVDAQDNNKIR